MLDSDSVGGLHDCNDASLVCGCPVTGVLLLLLLLVVVSVVVVV
jgi:hypothetical protein